MRNIPYNKQSTRNYRVKCFIKKTPQQQQQHGLLTLFRENKSMPSIKPSSLPTTRSFPSVPNSCSPNKVISLLHVSEEHSKTHNRFLLV